MDNNLFELVFQESVSAKIATDRFLTEYYLKSGCRSIMNAALKAEDSMAYFLQFAGKAKSDAVLRHIPSIFSVVSKDVLVLNPSYFPIKEIHKKLLIMDWREFEYFSSDILQICFKAVDVRTTQPTADGGLDFSGKLAITPVSSNEPYGYIEIYGQSKRYANNVGIEDVKSFVAFANSKKRNYVHHPQLFFFFTTSAFAPNASSELNENGFLGFSGLQLANIIFLHKELLESKSDIFRQTFVGKENQNKTARPE